MPQGEKESRILSQLQEQISAKDLDDRFEGFLKMTNFWIRRDVDKAESYAHSWLKLAKAEANQYQELLCRNKCHVVHLYRGNKAKAREGFLGLLKQAEELQILDLCSALCNNIAVTYQIADREKHLSYLQKAIGYSRACNHLDFLAIQLSNYANTLVADGDIDAALPFFQESSQIARQQNNLERMMWNSFYLGGYYLEQKQLDKAESLLQTAAELNKSVEHKNFRTQLQITTLELHSAQKQFAKCIELAEQLLSKSEIQSHKLHLRRCLILVGEAYLGQNNLEAAEKHLERARELIDPENFLDLAFALEHLETIALSKKDYKKAHQLLQERMQINQEFHAVDKTEAMSRMRVKFDAERKERENESLKIKVEQSEKIASQNKELQRLNSTKDKFFGIIAHDIRSPIIALEGVGEQMQYYLDRGKEEKLLNLAVRVDNTARRLSSLLDNLLSWALLQQGLIPYNPKTLNLSELVDETAMMFSHNAFLKNVKLSQEVPKQTVVYADESGLKTIMRNLLSNAIKYSHREGEVRTLVETRGSEVQIQVKDNGIGIPSNDLKKLFTLNTKSQKGTAGERGTGLGLNLVLELVKLNKGQISVASEPGLGTCITIIFPTDS